MYTHTILDGSPWLKIESELLRVRVSVSHIRPLNLLTEFHENWYER